MNAAAAAGPLLVRLRAALRDSASPFADARLEAMADKGLAHHHVRLAGTGLVARLPKQSQMGLPAAANLAYEAACFERAHPSGATPALHGVIAPGPGLPRGGLLVEEVIGRDARLPQDLQAIAEALAAIHALPLPSPTERAPLLDSLDPLSALRQEIEAQAIHLDAAALSAASRRLVDAERADLEWRCAAVPRPTRRLVAFDAHPGNFMLRADGRAVLVDMEKARYSHPPLDLAHATLYTSTTWDVATHAELSVAEVESAYAAWDRKAALGPADRTWFVPLRSAMWLWSVTWCAKWRALSPLDARPGADGQDWSHRHSEDALVAHVRDRVDCYLSAPAIERVIDELAALHTRFARWSA